MADAGSFTETTGFLLHRLGVGVDRVIERTLAPLDLRGRELRVLALLGSDVRSQAELVALSGLDRTTMVAVIDRLEELGLVERRPDPADRRKRAVVATSVGAARLTDAGRLLDQAEADVLEPLTARQQGDLNALLRKLFAVRRPEC